MKIVNYISLTELFEEVLHVEYEDGTWERIGYLWDAWNFLNNKGRVKVDYNTFVTGGLWRNLVTPEEIAIFVESLKDSKNTII